MMLILDDLIREGSVPPAFGIGIAPGMVCSPDGEVIRNNRSYEFDRMTGTHAPKPLDINVLTISEVSFYGTPE